MSIKSVLCLLWFSLLVTELYSSAIPMWEFLSKQEKMSYLYSMFANQVDTFCSSVDMKGCNQKLLDYGLNKLKDMPEDHLDTMDPYQRDAHNIIWDSMMAGHEMKEQSNKFVHLSTRRTIEKPKKFNDEPINNQYSFENSASTRINNAYRTPTQKKSLINYETGTPQYTYPHNLVPYLSTINKINYNRNNIRSQINYGSTESTYQSKHLTGPMVIKVYPNGVAIKEESSTPQDEDLVHYKMSKFRILK